MLFPNYKSNPPKNQKGQCLVGFLYILKMNQVQNLLDSFEKKQSVFEYFVVILETIQDKFSQKSLQEILSLKSQNIKKQSPFLNEKLQLIFLPLIRTVFDQSKEEAPKSKVK